MKSGIHHPLLCRALTVVLASALMIPVAATPAAAATEATFTFDGGGWGHGIGLSQYGARGYALAGRTYDWILAHYYQGTRLVTKPAVTVKVNLNRTAAARNSWQIMAGGSTALTVYQVSSPTIKATLDATKRYWIVTGSGNTALYRDQTYTVVRTDGTTAVGHRPGTLVKRFTGASVATAGGLVRMMSASGPWDQTGIVWRGYIRFNPYTSTTSKAINHVHIEQYLYGVVPRESPSSWPAEALKAQAVAARSYAYQDAKEGRTLYCTTMSQVYNGVSRPGYTHETVSTNAAVKATTGRLVWCGTETQPVKTFFFSSSGGYTASIQDVWTSSTPKPYYRGVPDADSAGNPNYRWTVGPLAASTVTSKIRAKDSGSVTEPELNYSAPYPYKIISMTAERATSGYAHHVNVRWSNGASYRIKGDTVRSALGLKSTKFSILNLNPGAVAYQETDSRFARYGVWQSGSSTILSGGTMSYSATYGSRFIAAFDGSGFSWIGNKAPTYGIAKVYLDGVLLGSVDLYSSSRAYQTKLFAKSGLADRRHTLTIFVTGAKNSRSTGKTVAVDRIDVTGSLAQATEPVSVVEQDNARVAWFGEWSTWPLVPSGSLAYTDVEGAEVIARFTGSGIKWIGTASSKYGSAEVSLDGGAPTIVSLTSAETTYTKVHWSVSGLDRSKVHSVRIRALGPSSGGEGLISVDRFEILGGWINPPILPSALIESNSSNIVYNGTWSTAARTELSGGSHRYSTSPTATAQLVFDGNSIAWIATKSKGYGRAEVWLDGVKTATVDLYTPYRYLFRQTVWQSPALPARRHTLMIKVLGTKNVSSTGTYVSVDAFSLAGKVVAP